MRDDLGTLAVGVDGIVGKKITVEAVSELDLEDERAYGTSDEGEDALERYRAV